MQYRTNITDSSWLDLNGDVFATTTTASKTDSTIGTALPRFYRVGLQPRTLLACASWPERDDPPTFRDILGD